MTTAAERNRSIRARRVANGMCAFCFRPLASKFMCAEHLEAHRLRQRRPAPAAAVQISVGAATERRAEQARRIIETREDAAHDPPTPAPVSVAMRSPPRPIKPAGPGPRSTFSVGDTVSWHVILPGLGANGVAQRIQLTGRVVAIDTTQTRTNYIVRHQSSGAEFRRPANELVLAQVESEVTK